MTFLGWRSRKCCDVTVLVLPPVTVGVLPLQNNAANLAADFSAIKELDSLSNEIVELQRWVITAAPLTLNTAHFADE